MAAVNLSEPAWDSPFRRLGYSLTRAATPENYLQDRAYPDVFSSWYDNVVVPQLYKVRPMLENYVDVIEASKILDVHPETVKRLIREGKLTATKFGNKWIMELDRLRVFANTYDGRRGRARRLL